MSETTKSDLRGGRLTVLLLVIVDGLAFISVFGGEADGVRLFVSTVPAHRVVERNVRSAAIVTIPRLFFICPPFVHIE